MAEMHGVSYLKEQIKSAKNAYQLKWIQNMKI